MGIFSGRESPRANFLANPRKLQAQKQNIRRRGVEGMTVPSSPCFGARLGSGAPGTPRGHRGDISDTLRTHRGRAAPAAAPQLLCAGSREGRGRRKLFRFCKHLSVSPAGSVRARCPRAPRGRGRCAVEPTNHRLKTREGNLVVLNGPCGVALPRFVFISFHHHQPPKNPSPVWKRQ